MFYNQKIQILVLSAISGANLFLGISIAQAQNFSPQEINNYARTVLKLEPLRIEAYNDIKQKIGSENIPEIICNKPETISALRADIRPIAVSYCQQSKQIVDTNGLTTEKFNEITITQQNNPSLQKQIQNILNRLQKNP